jgi:aldehyde:ferredoxin oxidoreductase
MNQEQLRTLAYDCGAKPHTQGIMRAVTGVSMTYEQLTKLATRLGGPWKEAVLNELIVAHIYQAKHDTDPRRAVQDAISWNTDIALDPQVSSDAQKLIDRGAEQERKRCCAIIFGMCSSDNVAQRTVDAIWKGRK